MAVVELTHDALRMQNHRAAAAVVAADGGAAIRRICHIGSEIGVGNVSPGTDGRWTNDDGNPWGLGDDIAIDAIGGWIGDGDGRKIYFMVLDRSCIPRTATATERIEFEALHLDRIISKRIGL